MKKIFKYPLEITGRQTIEVPAGSKVLTVQMQHGVPCMWALVDPSANNSLLNLVVFGTGHPIESMENLSYIGTFQADGGNFVGHVFEYHPFYPPYPMSNDKPNNRDFNTEARELIAHLKHAGEYIQQKAAPASALESYGIEIYKNSQELLKLVDEWKASGNNKPAPKSIEDYAIAAMQGMLAGSRQMVTAEKLATTSFEIATAMLKEREKHI